MADGAPDPVKALRDMLKQINDLSGASLDLIDQASGGAESGGEAEQPAPEGEEVPAPPA